MLFHVFSSVAKNGTISTPPTEMLRASASLRQSDCYTHHKRGGFFPEIKELFKHCIITTLFILFFYTEGIIKIKSFSVT